MANEAAQLEVAIVAAGLDPNAAGSYPIWTAWQTNGLRAALAALREESTMTVDAPASAAEQLAATHAALTKAREKRRRVEHLATTGDYSTRAAARVQLEDVDADVVRLESEIGPLQLAADREATLAELVRLAADGRAALADIERTCAAFDAAIAPLLDAYSDAQRRRQAARSAFYRALGSIGPDEVEHTGADLTGVLANISEPRDRVHDRHYTHAHDFPGALKQAIREEIVRRLGYALPPDAIISVLPPKENHVNE